MRNIKLALWGFLILLTALWFWVDTDVFQARTVFQIRGFAVQYTGIIAMGVMSLAMILALRPRWLEGRLDGLDKMYRLHKWLGITALVTGLTHWLWVQGVRWATGWGLLQRPPRGPRAPIENPIQAALSGWRGVAENIGEWAFYAALALIIIALVKAFPYRLFYKIHRLFPAVYLALVFHAIVLIKFSYWTTPLGILMALLLAGGTFSALVSLFGRIGARRQVEGTIQALTPFPGMRALEAVVSLPKGWPGHRPGQFAFARSDPREGAHPYTIASGWNDGWTEAERRISFVIKALGDHTERLPQKLKTGQKVRIEGPYGCFTFDDERPHQIWIGAGIGITPFLARMQHMAMRDEARDWPEGQTIDLFHPISEVDEAALAQLAAHAQAANVHLHVLVSARDGRLDGAKIRDEVPDWREASLWFCGPAGFGASLRADFASQGFEIRQHFHQELFEMR